MKKKLTCFRKYDVRGELGTEINEDISYQIGRSVAEYFNAKNMVVGFDARETSPRLATALQRGICDSGSDVFEIGLSGTEEMYWAVSGFEADAGITITASHNPINYNGMKIVKHGSRPLTDKEFADIKISAEENNFYKSDKQGSIIDIRKKARRAYLDKIISLIEIKCLKPFKIVINSGNGTAGPVLDALIEKLELESVKADFVKVHHDPDSTFPNGIPNPLLEENRKATIDMIKREQADFGVAFDGDFDRCFLFDHFGNFVPGEYIVGLMAQFFLSKDPNSIIIHDPRVIWNTIDVVENNGGKALVSKTGHAFLKRLMRDVDAVYGGEMSAHHYFREFAYCDSGMIPWLLIWQLLSKNNTDLANLVSHRKYKFPSSGEINFKVDDALSCLKRVKERYISSSKIYDELDGLSMNFENWRFNLRSSNTEPLVRLNVETKGDKTLLKSKVEQLTKLINDA